MSWLKRDWDDPLNRNNLSDAGYLQEQAENKRIEKALFFTKDFEKKFDEVDNFKKLDFSKIKTASITPANVNVVLDDFSYFLDFSKKELKIITEEEVIVNIASNIEYIELYHQPLIDYISKLLKKKKVLKNQVYSAQLRAAIKELKSILKNKYRIQHDTHLADFTKKRLCKIDKYMNDDQYNFEYFCSVFDENVVKRYGDNYSNIKSLERFKKISNKMLIDFYKKEIKENNSGRFANSKILEQIKECFDLMKKNHYQEILNDEQVDELIDELAQEFANDYAKNFNDDQIELKNCYSRINHLLRTNL